VFAAGQDRAWQPSGSDVPPRERGLLRISAPWAVDGVLKKRFERVCEPLDLDHTGITLTSDMQAHIRMHAVSTADNVLGHLQLVQEGLGFALLPDSHLVWPICPARDGGLIDLLDAFAGWRLSSERASSRIVGEEGAPQRSALSDTRRSARLDSTCLRVRD
jgi:hypothetical protein